MNEILIRTTALAILCTASCSSLADSQPEAVPDIPFQMDGNPSSLATSCEPDNGGISLPEGFCAIVVATNVRGARHLVVAENGDIFVSRRNRGDERGGITALRDLDANGRSDTAAAWGVNGGNDVLLADGFLYHSPNDAVIRYPLAAKSLVPRGAPDTIVAALRDSANHSAKSIALRPDGSLFVSVGAPGNSCMARSSTPGSPGMDPCPLLETGGGIWKFDADNPGQTLKDGVHFSTGLRNVMAVGVHPHTGVLYAAIHGRDQLHQLWPDLYTEEQSAENPAEELVEVTEGSNFGWPYCYHDAQSGRKVLAPEYGGDGSAEGRCKRMNTPIIGFPAHWAPNDLEFYTGKQFPNFFRNGMFIAFHGSWNRAPLPQDGYRVVFVPAAGDVPGSDWFVFADGFVREGLLRDQTFRPVGLAVGPDGSLYVADSLHGRIWRIVYKGTGN